MLVVKHTKNEKVERANNFIRKMREDNFSKGWHFLIYDSQLPEGQTYVEYPDGNINIEFLKNATESFVIIRRLTFVQAKRVRIRFGLIAR